MARITLKITKPVDSTALPKEPTSRAKRAMHRKGMPKGPALPPAPPAPSAAAASPPKATARPAETSARATKHRGKPSPSAAGRGEPAPTDARRAASTSSDSRRGKPPHAEASSRRRSTSGGAAPSGTADGTKKDFRSGEKRTYGAQARPARGGPPESKYGARRAPSDRTKPGPPTSSPVHAHKRQGVKAEPASPPRHENPDDPRLSKRMSELGLCSRREADEWIENGWVRVDGKVVTTLGVRVSPHARIEIEKAAQQHQSEQVTIILNKPMGYVSGQPEDDHQPAMVLIKPENRWPDDPSPITFKPSHLRGLAPAGRLDIDSTGLIVFTQDGRIAKQLVGTNSAVEKEYLVRVEGTLTDAGMKLLQHGLELDGVKLKPARVSWQNEDQLRFVLREGRKRQIRRMCELVGLTVTGLKRVRSGSVPLGALPVGQWRYLRRDEKF